MTPGSAEVGSQCNPKQSGCVTQTDQSGVPDMSRSLTLPENKLAFIIEKAREFDVQLEPDDPDSGSNAADDNGIAILEEGGGNPAEAELKATLRTLNEDELAELVALVAVGEGDYDEASWDEALREARATKDRRTIATLLATPMLGELISEGLAALGNDVPLPPEEEPAQGTLRPEA